MFSFSNFIVSIVVFDFFSFMLEFSGIGFFVLLKIVLLVVLLCDLCFLVFYI